MLRRWRQRRRCWKLSRASENATLAEYLEVCAHLQPDNLANTPLIAVDLELTGLDRRNDQIIAIGWTLINEGRIQFSGNRHMLIAAGQSVGSSATIHELMDSEVAEGEPLEAGLEALFRAATGRVWVFHHAGLDLGFLKTACRHWAGVSPAFLVLDTMQIEHQQRKRREVPVKQGDMQLGKLREEYGLPRYVAHNALNDAIATAELTLAIAARLEPDASLRLAPYLRYY